MLSLLKLSSQFYRLALVQNLTLYHGTDGKYLPKILHEGLDPRKSKSPSKSVYLTSDFATAARYGTWSEMYTHSIPIILEIHLSGQQNIKKLIRDELDHPSDWHDDESVYDNGRNELFDFIRQIRNTFHYVPESLAHPSSWEEIFGQNLYKIIIQDARSSGEDVEQIKKLLFSKFRNYSDEYAEIAEDGTIIPTSNFYEEMHQSKYRKRIPGNAIKAVYVGNFKEPEPSSPEQLKLLNLSNREQRKQAPALLAWEAKNLFESLQESLSGLPEISSKQEALDFFEETSEIDEYGVFEEDWKDIKQQISQISEENIDQEFIEDLARNFINDIQNKWGDQVEARPMSWVKLTPQQALYYMNKHLSDEPESSI